ncbi:MAG: hypothetical protein HY265_04605 [Deltaproteobacteria bacterium]|nr:hypothetical protein [Deltaproteobacteria bacterium]
MFAQRGDYKKVKEEKVVEQPIKQEAVEADAKGEKGQAARVEAKDDAAEMPEAQ